MTSVNPINTFITPHVIPNAEEAWLKNALEAQKKKTAEGDKPFLSGAIVKEGSRPVFSPIQTPQGWKLQASIDWVLCDGTDYKETVIIDPLEDCNPVLSYGSRKERAQAKIALAKAHTALRLYVENRLKNIRLEENYLVDHDGENTIKYTFIHNPKETDLKKVYTYSPYSDSEGNTIAMPVEDRKTAKLFSGLFQGKSPGFFVRKPKAKIVLDDDAKTDVIDYRNMCLGIKYFDRPHALRIKVDSEGLTHLKKCSWFKALFLRCSDKHKKRISTLLNNHSNALKTDGQQSKNSKVAEKADELYNLIHLI